MADMTFGGGNGLLIPNTLLIHKLQKESRTDDKLIVNNIGGGELAFSLPNRYLDKDQSVVTLPYAFTVNGEPVNDRPILLPVGETVFEVEKGGVLTTETAIEFGDPRPILDSELPANSANANIIAGAY